MLADYTHSHMYMLPPGIAQELGLPLAAEGAGQGGQVFVGLETAALRAGGAPARAGGESRRYELEAPLHFACVCVVAGFVCLAVVLIAVLAST